MVADVITESTANVSVYHTTNILQLTITASPNALKYKSAEKNPALAYYNRELWKIPESCSVFQCELQHIPYLDGSELPLGSNAL